MKRPSKQARSEAGRLLNSLRKTRSGGHNGGRPRSGAPRCACGEMTLKRALARGHKCA